MDDPTVPEIDVNDLEARMVGGVHVLDVREPHEYDEAHIAGVLLMPLESVPTRIAEVPTDQPVYIVCRTGGRSHHAAEFLRQQGVDAINVAGGTKGWIEAGKPFETG